MNNKFWSLVKRFANDWRFAQLVTKIVIHGKQYLILYTSLLSQAMYWMFIVSILEKITLL